MTRGELVQRVGEELGLNYTVAGTEQTLLQNWANAAVLDVMLRTHIAVKVGTINLANNTSSYALGFTVMELDDGQGYVPERVGSFVVLTSAEIQKTTQTYRSYISIEGTTALVKPTPTGSSTLTFAYVGKPTAMTGDSNDPSSDTYGGIPSEWHEALFYYVAWKAAEYDDKSSQTGGFAAQEYHNYYLGECQRMVDWRKRKEMGRGRRKTGATK